MAKKFVRVNGLHTIFDTDGVEYNTSSLSESANPDLVSELSVCFITADATDIALNSKYDGKFIWTHGILFPCKEGDDKQDKLTAGAGIEISGNTISVTDMMPIGSITMWATANPPTGWLICNGQSIASGDEYAALRTALGGASVVPDLTGRFPLGANATHALGDSGGTEEEALTINEMPSHAHGITKGYHYGGSSELSPDVTLNTYNLNSRNVRQSTADSVIANPEDFYPANYTDLNGLGQPHNNMPPYFVINYIIKYM